MSSNAGADDGLPLQLGPFLLFDKIGQGGMAEIFLATSEGALGQRRLVVIKKVRPGLAADPQFAEMLVEEAKLCAALRHQNVVQVLDLGRIDGQLFIAMEYVEGFDLNDLLRRCTKAKLPLPAEFAFFVILETLCALDYAHRAADSSGSPLGIIHRDVSPTNVLISTEGEVKLCDFGIARAVLRDGSLNEGALKGKFGYMAPEHARGEPVDRRSDLFAAGILLWELVSGRRLYRGKDANETLELARAAVVPPLPDRGLPNPEELAAIAGRALAREPDDRYQSAAEMLEELDRYLFNARLRASQLRFAEVLRRSFGEELQRQRRARERSSAPHSVPLEQAVPDEAVVAPEPARPVEPGGPTPLAEAPPGPGAALPTPSMEDLAARTTELQPIRDGAPGWRTVAVGIALALIGLAAGVYLLLGR